MMQQATPIKPGDLLADRYRIESLLGSGGHAHVFLARQEKLDRKVAIKILKSSPGTAGAEESHKHAVLIKRFDQEARLISQLRDPHTITMFDYGTTHDGLFYMVCEYIEGESLKELLLREGAIEPARVVKILEQLLLSLQEAHALGVLHRDLKPDNIMIYKHLGRRDQVKLLDFGIAKLADGGDGDHDLTAEGSLVGTPRYIAPERIRGEPIRPCSDLYSLGLIAYELLTGQKVMGGLSGVRALQSQLGDPSLKIPPALDIPPKLRAIINRLMEKDQHQRYQVAEQVLDELVDWQASGASTPARAAAASAPSGSAVAAREATERLKAKHRATAPATVTPPSSPTPFSAPIVGPAHTTGHPSKRATVATSGGKTHYKFAMVSVIALLVLAIAGAIGMLAWLIMRP